MISLNMPVGELYGWAICGKYLLRHLSKETDVGYIEGSFKEQIREGEDDALVEDHRMPDCVNFGTIIHTLTPEFKPSCHSWGSKNIGYMFYEKEHVSNEQKKNLHRFSTIVAGSDWNAEVIRKNGFDCISVPQGVDQEIFKYKKPENEKFVIFSGGKWEPRKAQSIVIEAYKILKDKHKDVYLMGSWYNLFDEKLRHDMEKKTNGVKGLLKITLCNHRDLACYMHNTDIGVFPNTAEGGTNLVLMEYLSSGRPAIVNVSTGQKDVTHEDYAYCMDGKRLLDDTVDHLEYAYNHREELVEKGKLAHKAMKYFSWERMANRFLSL